MKRFYFGSKISYVLFMFVVFAALGCESMNKNKHTLFQRESEVQATQNLNEQEQSSGECANPSVNKRPDVVMPPTQTLQTEPTTITAPKEWTYVGDDKAKKEAKEGEQQHSPMVEVPKESAPKPKAPVAPLPKAQKNEGQNTYRFSPNVQPKVENTGAKQQTKEELEPPKKDTKKDGNILKKNPRKKKSNLLIGPAYVAQQYGEFEELNELQVLYTSYNDFEDFEDKFIVRGQESASSTEEEEATEEEAKEQENNSSIVTLGFATNAGKATYQKILDWLLIITSLLILVEVFVWIRLKVANCQFKWTKAFWSLLIINVAFLALIMAVLIILIEHLNNLL